MKPAEKSPAKDGQRPRLIRSLAGLSRSVLIGAWVALLVVSMAMLCQGQISGQNSGRAGIHDQASPDLSDDSMPSVNQHFAGNSGDTAFQERRMRQLNALQHKAMVSDTDRLLSLVKELNAEISNSTEGSLTAEQLRKVAEIEKLAHGVKDKMRITVQPVASRYDATQHLRSN